jgi:hypothetical protein
MPQISPTIEGFRAAFRRPSLTFAEVAWRWSTGAAAAALVTLAVFEYCDSLRVTDLEASLLATRQPLLALQVLLHIFRGTISRVLAASLIIGVAVSLAWIVVGSVGRAATVRALLDYFRSTARFSSSEHQNQAAAFRPLMAINFWRLVAALAGLLGFVGVGTLFRLIPPQLNAHSALAYSVLVLLVSLISIVWAQLNWTLSLACIFAVRDGEDALGAIFAAVTFLGERAGSVLSVETWNVVAHVAALGGGTTLVSMLLAFVPVVPARVIIAGGLLVMLGYWALVDWLYMARQAGYICIAEMPSALASPSVPERPIAPHAIGDLPTGNSVQTTIDASEPILSDLLKLASEA